MKSRRVRKWGVFVVAILVAVTICLRTVTRSTRAEPTSASADRPVSAAPTPDTDLPTGALSAAEVARERISAATQDGSARPNSDDTGLIFGRVTDEDGLGLVDIRVRFEPLAGRVVDALTDLDGNYTIGSLPLWRGSLRSSADGYVPFKTGIELTSAEPRMRVDVVLAESHRLNIILRKPDGAQFMQDWNPDSNLFNDLRLTFGPVRPRIGENVPAEDRGDAVQIGSGWPDAPIGVWRVVETPGVRGTFACLSLGLLVIDAQPIPLHADTLFLVADIDAVRDRLGHVTAVVVDASTGMPIEGATLNWGTMPGAGSSAITDARGRARSRDLVPGSYRLTVSHPTHIDLHSYSNVSAGSDMDMGVVRLDPGIRISGRIEFPDGTTGVTGLVCWRVYYHGDKVYAGTRKVLATSEDGAFRFETLEQGQYALVPDALHETTSTDITALIAGQRIVDAERGSVEGIVVRVPSPIPRAR